ncbi:hypothetical protein [Massilia sp. NR 4-1]|uniref:hypothetical protein n=1 Tax=Massilia sp. NR 4-1 TaxID=1678028 RepID=UPI00067B8077|nr:hypothetical protein [Massilia sp. NR 4-1]AKU21889.1 hypothetical protein ACZ75_10835 [Massilia sp. NR 4-1]
MTWRIFIFWVALCLLVGVAGFFAGRFSASVSCDAKEVTAERVDAKAKKRKDKRALASGVRTEQAQAKTDSFFNTLRTNYENDQRVDGHVGCVLDPVSLRRWNEANAQSDGRAASEPDDGMPEDTAAAEDGGRPGDESP